MQILLTTPQGVGLLRFRKTVKSEGTVSTRLFSLQLSTANLRVPRTTFISDQLAINSGVTTATLGSKIHWKESHNSLKINTLTVAFIIDLGNKSEPAKGRGI